jgi:hypothetical protein
MIEREAFQRLVSGPFKLANKLRGGSSRLTASVTCTVIVNSSETPAMAVNVSRIRGLAPPYQ